MAVGKLLVEVDLRQEQPPTLWLLPEPDSGHEPAQLKVVNALLACRARVWMLVAAIVEDLSER